MQWKKRPQRCKCGTEQAKVLKELVKRFATFTPWLLACLGTWFFAFSRKTACNAACRTGKTQQAVALALVINFILTHLIWRWLGAGQTLTTKNVCSGNYNYNDNDNDICFTRALKWIMMFHTAPITRWQEVEKMKAPHPLTDSLGQHRNPLTTTPPSVLNSKTKKPFKQIKYARLSRNFVTSQNWIDMPLLLSNSISYSVSRNGVNC